MNYDLHSFLCCVSWLENFRGSSYLTSFISFPSVKTLEKNLFQDKKQKKEFYSVLHKKKLFWIIINCHDEKKPQNISHETEWKIIVLQSGNKNEFLFPGEQTFGFFMLNRAERITFFFSLELTREKNSP